jgi:hypothetical protein
MASVTLDPISIDAQFSADRGMPRHNAAREENEIT